MTDREGTHLCPAQKCPRWVPNHLLMCGIHWRLTPAVYQRAVNAAYDHGQGLGTVQLLAAQRTAIRAVNQLLERTHDHA